MTFKSECDKPSTFAKHIDDLPNEILQKVFIHINGTDLCKKVSLVCKKWNGLINNEQFWIQKSIFDQRIDTVLIKKLQDENIYQAKILYFENHFNRNFIKNPCGDQGFNHWYFLDFEVDHSNFGIKNHDKLLKYYRKRNVLEHYKKNCKHKPSLVERKNWKIQTVHNGSEPLFDSKGKKIRNFFTSFNIGPKIQIIDLDSIGFLKYLKANVQFQIEISESYAARRDYSYNILVRLLGKNFEELEEFQFFKVIESNTGEWHHLKHVFKTIPKDIHYIFYYHNGIDSEYWARHSGINMTNSSVRILLS